MPKIIGNPTITPMAVPDWNQTDPTKADYIKNKPDVYKKSEVDTKLNVKANKSDISNVYKFLGSVEKFEYLPQAKYKITPTSTEIKDDNQVVGEYNHDNRTITIFDEYLGEWIHDAYSIKIPIEPITLPKGLYRLDTDDYNFSIGGEPTYNIGVSYDVTEDYVVINYICFGATDAPGAYPSGGVVPEYINLVENIGGVEGCVPVTINSGTVYNVQDTGMNYAWTGTEWDALGGVSKDEDMQQEIDELKNQLDEKVDKTDISNIYKFKGSVETFDDLPFEYKLIPNIDVEKGIVPILNDEPLAVDKYKYDAETHTLEVENLLISFGDKLIIPIVPITVKSGNYYHTNTKIGDLRIGEYNVYGAATEQAYVSMKEQTIEFAELGRDGKEHTINTKTDSLLSLVKIIDSWLTDEYAPNLPIIPSDAFDKGNVYHVLKDGESYGVNYAWTGTDWCVLGGSTEDSSHRNDTNNPHKVTASQVGAYTKTEVDKKLNEKANKSDISNVYKFIGSVEKFEYLPLQYPLIPNGVPTINGEPCGSFENGKLTFNEMLLERDVEIIVPIKRIELKPGYYYIDGINAECFSSVIYVKIGHINSYGCGMHKTPYEIREMEIVDYITIWNHNANVEISGSTTTFGTLPKVDESWFEYDQESNIPYEIYEQGAVYNVQDTGMNYAWTGTEWDALGGVHRDNEAHLRIDEIVSQIGMIDAKLDEIIDEQTRLIGGGSV